MQLRHVIEIVLGRSRDDGRQTVRVGSPLTARAHELLLEVRELAEAADGEDRRYIAWRMSQVTNDVCYLAEHTRFVPGVRPAPEIAQHRRAICERPSSYLRRVA